MTQHSIKKNSVYSIIKTGASILFPFITFPYISRVLLTDNVGKIQYGLSIVSYFSLIASLGISTYAVRECSGVRDDKQKLSQTASQIYSINIIFTIISYFALAITLLLYHTLDNYRTLIIIQSITIMATTLGADWLNSAMEDLKYITIRTVSFQFLSLLLMFIFVRNENDYMKYAIISVVSSAGASITNIWYRKRYCPVRFTAKIEWKMHMAPIMFLFVMVLAQTIFNSVDSTMLGSIHGDHEVGIYSAAHKISNIINQIAGSLLWVIMPRMAYYYAEKDYESINRLLRKILQFNITLGLPCVIGTMILSKDIISAVAGTAYVEATPVLQILMLGLLFSLIGGNFLGNAILLPAKQEKYYMIVCCLSAVVNIIANYIFIPIYGATAAAGTTAVCSLVILVLLLFKVDKKVKIQGIGRLVISPIVGCLGIVLVCIICSKVDNLWLRVLISLIGSVSIYSLIQWCMKNELITDVLQVVKKRRANKLWERKKNES